MINDFSFLTLIASIRYVQNGQNHLAAPTLINTTISISIIQLSKIQIKKKCPQPILLFLLFMKDNSDVSLLLLGFFCQSMLFLKTLNNESMLPLIKID